MTTSQERIARIDGAIAHLREEITDLTTQLAWWERKRAHEQPSHSSVSPSLEDVGKIGHAPSQRRRSPVRQPRQRLRRTIAPTEHVIIALLQEAGRPQTVAELKYPAFERGLIVSKNGMPGVRNHISSLLARMLIQGRVTHNDTTHRYGLPSWSSTNERNGQGELPTLAKAPKNGVAATSTTIFPEGIALEPFGHGLTQEHRQ